MEFINFLQKWQEIVGAFIGGMTGFVAAFFVAYDARRRDEVTSAKILIGDLLAISGRTEASDQYVQRKEVSKEDKEKAFVLHYLMRKPILSPLFYVSMARVISCDRNLGARLYAFSMIYRNVEESLTWFQDKYDKHYEAREKLQLTSKMEKELNNIYEGLHLASKHAKAIIDLLNIFVLPCFLARVWNKLTFFSNKCGCECGCEKVNIDSCRKDVDHQK